MAYRQKKFIVPAVAAVAIGFVTFPYASEYALSATPETVETAAPVIEIDESRLAPAVEPQSETPALPEVATKIDNTPADVADDKLSPKAEKAVAAAGQYGVDSETLCLAKIVHHESANQPHDGQLAVAQVVMNRVGHPSFAKTICGVVMQKNQFFNVHAYNPPKDKRWQKAIDIALDARNKVSAPVVGNALFFQATWADTAFFRSRKHVRRIAGHNFYR